MAVNDYIVPIDESFFTKETINPDDYQQNVMSTLIAGENSYYGFPLDIHPIVLYYNKEIVGDNQVAHQLFRIDDSCSEAYE